MTHTFGRHYAEAREEFLRLAADRQADVESIKHPLRGPDGERLHVDVATLGSTDAAKAMVLMSGTHGVEGLCGSYVQRRTLGEIDSEILPPDIKLVMIHAINPHGFAWLRRTTEEGVDLCRNFVNFNESLPRNPIYDDLADLLVPQEWHGAGREQADAELARIIQEIGPEAYSAQVPLGQYTHWYAPFYGGDAPTWSNRVFHRLCEQHLAACSRVATIDYHTGLGAHGHGELLCFHDPGSEALARAGRWWGNRLTSVFDNSETVAYPLTGGILEGMEKALPNTQLTAAAFEFGTQPSSQVMSALRADHWLHAYGDFHDPIVPEVKAQMRQAFFDDSEEWLGQVWQQSSQAQHAALDGLKEER